LTDAVEKVSDDPSVRNNRSMAIVFLNRCCVFTAVLESMLLAQAPQNTTASTRTGHVQSKMVQRKLAIASHTMGRKFMFQ
jgi:hypothetical protein